MRYEFVQMCMLHRQTFPASQQCPDCKTKFARRWMLTGTEKGEMVNPAFGATLHVGETVSVIEILEEE